MDSADKDQSHPSSKRAFGVIPTFTVGSLAGRMAFETSIVDFNPANFLGATGKSALSVDPTRAAAITESIARYQSSDRSRWGTGREPTFEPGTPGSFKRSLALDDDVAALLERAPRERGRSLEEMANELLRRTLRQLGATGIGPESAVLPTPQQLETLPAEARINQLYDDIRDLVVRSAENPILEAEIERKREELRALQAREAAAWREQTQASRHLKPGEGYRLLERAASLLGS